jgi:hypothetical protein
VAAQDEDRYVAEGSLHSTLNKLYPTRLLRQKEGHACTSGYEKNHALTFSPSSGKRKRHTHTHLAIYVWGLHGQQVLIQRDQAEIKVPNHHVAVHSLLLQNALAPVLAHIDADWSGLSRK